MKFLKGLVCLLFLLIGIWIGFIVKNFPLIAWNKEVKIYEVFQVLVTLFIGLVIPFFIKKWIDDGRAVKSLLVDEAKEIVTTGKKIKDFLTECFTKKLIDINEKQYVLYLLSELEILLNNYNENLQQQFGNKSIPDFNLIIDAYNDYSNSLTQDEFMTDDFTVIPLDFLSANNLRLNVFIGALRNLSVKMQKL